MIKRCQYLCISREHDRTDFFTVMCLFICVNTLVTNAVPDFYAAVFRCGDVHIGSWAVVHLKTVMSLTEWPDHTFTRYKFLKAAQHTRCVPSNSVSLANICSYTVGHLIFRWNQSLKPWIKTKYRFETKIKLKHKVTLKFGFKPV